MTPLHSLLGGGKKSKCQTTSDLDLTNVSFQFLIYAEDIQNTLLNSGILIS